MRRVRLTLAGCALLLAGTSFVTALPALHAEEVQRLPAPALDPADARASATTVLAGGCFWGVEGVFSHVRGVTRVESGFHGGTAAAADYETVSSGATAHAEAVRITYDPRVVSYGTLLRVYFSVVIDPTTLNRQGPDSGRQYRSAIIPANASQRQVASAYLAQLGQGHYWARPIVTRIEAPLTFYRAEAYHQDFLARHPDHPYITAWDAPKLAALQRLYPALWQSNAAP